MDCLFNGVKCKFFTYLANVETGYFEKQPEIHAYQRLPFRLKRSPTQLTHIKVNAKELLHSDKQLKSGKYTFITGIQPIQGFKDWFSGNDYETVKRQKILSQILFYCNPNNRELLVFYFSRFYKQFPAERENFILDTIPQIIFLLNNTKGG